MATAARNTGQPAFPVGRPTGMCAATGVHLHAGERFCAALVERDDGSLERQDFAAGAWEAGARPLGRVFGSWRGVVPASDAAPKLRLDDAELLELFEGLAEATEERAIGLRYVLALLLVRRRVLRYEGAEAGRLWASHAGTAERGRIEVADPGLDGDHLAAVAEQLGECVSFE